MSQRVGTVLDRAAESIESPGARALEFSCAEVWGGNRDVHTPVRLPGLAGFVYSHPCHGARGGDVHYLSVCAAGLISRLCLVDVVGHGEAVAQVGRWLHGLLGKHMGRRDPREILAGLNARLAEAGLATMSTAACFSYHAMRGELRYCYAGHPPAWVYRHHSQSWSELSLPSSGREPDAGEGSGEPQNLVLGVQADVRFDLGMTVLEPGDRLLVFSDGLIETRSPSGELFTKQRLAERLMHHRHLDVHALGHAILDDLFAFADRCPLTHDDVTFVLLQATGRLTAPSLLWYVVRSRVRKLLARKRAHR